MQTLFLKEYDLNEKQSFIEKLISLYKRLFNVLEIKEIENNIICSIPTDAKKSEKHSKKISRKIYNKFFKEKTKIKKNFFNLHWPQNDYRVNKVVLSEKIRRNNAIEEELLKYKVKILDGKWLFKYLIVDVLDYLDTKENIRLRNQDVSILLDDSNNFNMSFITLIAKRVKRLRIITSKIARFRYIEEKLYNEYGIAIEVSNNRRKSLAKTDIIINVDFKEELINKYKISNNAFMINISENEIVGKRLKIVNGCRINFKTNNLLEDNNLYGYFNKEVLYESMIYRKDNLYNILNQMESDKVRIIKLLGDYEQKNITKPLDKIEKLS